MIKGRSFIAGFVVSMMSLGVYADSVSINIGSYSLGNLPGGGGADTRTAGGPNWWYPSNAATSAQVVTDGVNKVLNVYNNGNGNDGVIDNVHSPRLNSLAGETGLDAQPGATSNTFTSSYRFRTVSNTALAGFAFKSESWGQDRTTWLKFFNDGFGNLKANYSGVTTSTGLPNSDTFTDNIAAAILTWGAWYTVKTTVNFVNGPDNDTVLTQVYDSTNNLVINIADKTWENYYRLDSEQIPNGNKVTGVDSIQFQSRGSLVGAGNGVYIDDIKLSSFNTAVPLPTTAVTGMVLLGSAGAFYFGRRRMALA